MKRPGLYLIRNRISKRLYIGHSECTAQRIRQHRHKLRRGIHGNKILQSSWNKYGETAFQFRHIASVIDHDERCLLEITLIAKVKASGRKSFNIGEGGEGQPHTVESRRKIGLAHSGKLAPYMAELNRKRCLGKPLSAEHREKVRATSTGRRYPERNKSPEYRRKMSENRKKRRNLTWSEESKRKLSESKTGKKHSTQARLNMRAGRLRALARGQRSRIKLFTFNGQTHCIKEWAAIAGIKRQTLGYRLARGWSMERALTP